MADGGWHYPAMDSFSCIPGKQPSERGLTLQIQIFLSPPPLQLSSADQSTPSSGGIVMNPSVLSQRNSTSFSLPANDEGYSITAPGASQIPQNCSLNYKVNVKKPQQFRQKPYKVM